MKKYILLLIIVTILACGETGTNTTGHIESTDTKHYELTAPDTPATPVNTIK